MVRNFFFLSGGYFICWKVGVLGGKGKGGKSLCRQRETMKYGINKIYGAEVSTEFSTLEKYEALNSNRISANSNFATQSLCGFGKSWISPYLSGEVTEVIAFDTGDRAAGRLLRPQTRRQTCSPEPHRPQAPWDQEWCGTQCLLSIEQTLNPHFLYCLIWIFDLCFAGGGQMF